ncbi:MAG: pilus assembly protein TadG-related protein [Acidobacteriota bacterium]
MTIPQELNRRQRQRGVVLMTMAIAAIALIGAMGLAIDLGHVFIAKNETQAYVDAASIAAALQMDGTTEGITRANTAATSLSGAWNFSSSKITNPTVEFGNATAGPWYAPTAVNSGLAPTMNYVRVTKTVAPSIYFVPVVMTNPVYSQNVQSQAIAGQVAFSASTSIVAGLGPFMGVAACANGSSVASCIATSNSNFGLTVGNIYDIQWPQYNSHRAGCGNGIGNIDKCFNSPPCPGDDVLKGGNMNPMQEVVQNWGSSTNGYWGASSTSTINQYILDIKQLQAVSIGTDLTADFANGNKQGTAKIMDDRVNQDTVNFDTAGVSASGPQRLADYLANSGRNGRRLMPMPMVYPNATGSQVVGYGLYLLISNITSGGQSDYYEKGDGDITSGGKGNDPYCAIYAGPWVIGATNGGVSSSSAGGRVRLVQ